MSEFRPSTSFGWDYIVGGPGRGLGDLIRLRYLLLLFLHDVLTIFLFQGFPDKVITNLIGKTFTGKEATPVPQKIMFSLLDNT